MNSRLLVSVFIYTMPGYQCGIKERMLYASCCKSVVERVEAAGIEVAKKVSERKRERVRFPDFKSHILSPSRLRSIPVTS